MIHENHVENEGEEEDYEEQPKKSSNALPVWGNEKTMNLNTLLLTNIQGSHYFKVNLFELKTYHEVIDEIYYNVTHLEPWEKGSRKTGGQTGMCGGVRGVGVGGIVSTAFSCLYKLYTLKLTRKQLMGLLNHSDSPYLRGVGFMYLRYTQPPADLWTWFEPYLEDEEMIDVRAGGGEEMTIGVMLRKMLVKLDWYGTLFPRIPVPIQMKIQKLLKERFPPQGGPGDPPPSRPGSDRGDRGRDSRERIPPRARSGSRDRARAAPARDIAEEIAIEKDRIRREREGSARQDTADRRDRKHRSRSREQRRRSRSRSRDRKHRDKERSGKRSRSRERGSNGDRGVKRSGSKERRNSQDRKAKRSRSRDRKGIAKRSSSRDRKGSSDRAAKRSRSRDRKGSRDRPVKRSRSRDRKGIAKRSSSRDRKGSSDRAARRSRSPDRKGSRDRPAKRSRSRDRKGVAKRSSSRDRKGSTDRSSKRSRSRERKGSSDRAPKRSRSQDKKGSAKRSRSRDRKNKRSGSRERESRRRRDDRSRSRDRRR